MPNSTLLSGSAVALQPAAFGPVSTLVIIDANVDAVEQLVADIHPNTARTHRLRSDRSGVAQITEILAATPAVDAVHLVSHAEPGVLHLGNEKFSHQMLLHHIDKLMLWAEKLQGKDLVLYGCEVGQGARGYLYLQQLRQLTGANIVAASRPVGFQNWDLDIALGEPRSSIIFSEALQKSYLGRFIPTVNLSLSTDQLIETEGSLFTISFTLSEPPPAGGTVVTLAVDETSGFNRFDLGFGLQLNGISGFPADVSPNRDFSAFQFVLTAQNASVSFPILSTQADENLNGSGPIEDLASTPEVLTFTATATSGGTIGNGTATVTIYDNPSQLPAANRPPVADNETYSTPFNTPLSVNPANGVLIGDTDPDGDVLTAAIANQPSNGSVTLNSDGSFSYSPNSGFSGSDTFTYTANDGRGGTDNATVTVNVGAAPTPVVSLTSDITTLVEDEGTEVTFTISLSEPPPAGGLVIGLGTGKPFALGDFDVFPPAPQAVLTNAQVVGGFSDNSGLNLRITAQTATIRLPIFDDEDRTENGVVTDPTGPLRNDDIGDEQTTFSILAGTGYTVSPTASAVTLTLKDTNVVNGAPVADDDAYSTAFNTPLTVAAAEGVLNGDVDPDGDALSAAIATQPTSGTAALNADGSFTYTPNAGFSGIDSFTYTVSDGNGGTDQGNVAITVADAPPAPEPLVIGMSAIPTVLVEEEGTVTTLTFNLSEAPPAGGINVTINSGIPGSLAEFDVNAASFSGAQVVSANADASGLTINITQPGATITLPVFDDDVDEGPEQITYSLQPGEGYEVDGSASSVTWSIEDNDSVTQPSNPIVSFSTTPELISEAEGNALVLNFSVAGEIPEGGITVNLEGDVAEILQQFLAPDGDGAVQTRVTADGNLLYRFDTSFEADNANFGNIVGGILEVFALEDGDPAEDNSNPAAAGTGFLSNFSFTITESTASITLPVADDLVQEPDQTFTYTLAAGDGYTVNPEASSGTFTVTDGVPGGVGPTVGVTASPTTLIEAEQTVIEVTFTVDGEIPPEGLVVQFQGPPRAIAEFDVNATNPRLPENETVVEGVVVTGGNIVGTDEVAGSLFFRITESTATVTVPVFQDDVAEGTEVLPFTLVDGERYEVDPAASEVTITIEDVKSASDPTPGPGDSVGTEGNDSLAFKGGTAFGLGGDDNLFNIGGNSQQYGGPGNDGLYGNRNVDLLNGGDGNDRLYGNGGDDTFIGGAGNDQIFGGSGNDMVDGGDGDDIIYGNGGNDILGGGSGNDKLYGSSTAERFDGGAGDDFLYGNGGNDVFWGGAGNDQIFGGSGNDVIDGGDGDDIIYGNGGNDVLVGGAGNDKLYGSNTAERFDGGAGDDMLWLNGGQDVVVLRLGGGMDTIHGFQLGQTTFELVNGLQFGDLSFTQGNGFTSIFAGGAELAQVNWVNASNLDNAANFTTV